MAQRLLPRHLDGRRTSTADRSTGHAGVRRARCAAPLSHVARDRDQHLQRVQQLGRAQPLHRRQAGLVRADRSARNVRAPCRPNATIASRGRVYRGEEPDVDGDDLPAVPLRSTAIRGSWARPVGSRTSGGSSSGPRPPASSWTTRSPAISNTIPSVVDGYDLVLGVGHDEYWSAGQRATRSRRTSQRGQLRQHLRATRCSGRSAWRTAATRWSATSTRRTRPTRSSARTHRRR